MRATLLALWALIILAACGGVANSTSASQDGIETDSAQLTLAVYTTPREAYQELIPIFQKQWMDATGQ